VVLRSPLAQPAWQSQRAGKMEDTRSLRQSVLSAVGWATATRFIAQIANWAMTLATVRFLHPQDYGLMAMTMAVTSFLQPLSYAGLAAAIVQNRHLGDDDLRSVFGLVLLVNGAFVVVLWALAEPLAWLYHEPRLVLLMQVASLCFVASALQTIPRAALEKRLDLKTVSRVELVANVLGGACVLLLAWVGAGVWSLMLGTLLAAGLRAVGFGIAAPYFRRPRLSLRKISQILHFGGVRTLETLLWSTYSNADVFIIGKLLGSDVLGVYSISRYLAALPVEKLALVVNPVVFPAFARVQDDRNEAARYLIKAMRILAFLCFPVLFGVAATASQIVAAALGPKWAQAALPIAILAIAMTLRPIGLIIPSFLAGIGEYLASFKNTVFAAIVFGVAVIIGCHWGLIGVCTAWLVAYPLILLNLLRRVALVSGSSVRDLITPLLSPLAGSLIMYAVVRAITALLPAAAGGWSLLAVLAAIGALVYIGYALLFLRPILNELTELVRR
jgi:teichuronic acid exporter